MKKQTVKVLLLATSLIMGTWLFTGCGNAEKKTTMELQDFIKKLEAQYASLYKETALASWNAETTGNEEEYKKAADLEYKMSQIFANKNDFEKIKKIKESGHIKDELLVRQMNIIYNAFLGEQIDTNKTRAMIDKQSQISQTFNKFRPVVGTDTLTDNQIEATLRTSTDNKLLEESWNASKKSGAAVAEQVIELVKMRNEAAKELGFKNYHEMSLSLSEQDPEQIEKLFDELDSLTSDAFAQLKNEMDEYFAQRYKVKKEELMPWHYQNRFFQEAPKIYPVDLDVYYKDKDVVALTKTYFKGVGLDIDDMLAKSDMFERKGKNQHAFCTDIDREGDVRVLCNTQNNASWMNTLLHEFGHAVYSKYNDRALPYFLRDAAHTFTTEAIAMFFGRLASNPQWMVENLGISKEEAAKIADDCYKTLRLEQLTFSRWAQVMYRFEKGMYEDPDRGLNKLWWDLVEKYQLLKRPEGRNQPDWASKIHIALYPCYYHNYLMGELLASQLSYYVAKNYYNTENLNNVSFTNNPEVGKYMVEKVFKPGMKYEWNDMIEKATGEKLTAKYYAKQFVR
ncbi:MAG TPA: M2 family metallopeptidase [Bacteroidales bacterium]|nr:M2 family metallopeptidase [Bacteroidales bacterium]